MSTKLHIISIPKIWNYNRSALLVYKVNTQKCIMWFQVEMLKGLTDGELMLSHLSASFHSEWLIPLQKHTMPVAPHYTCWSICNGFRIHLVRVKGQMFVLHNYIATTKYEAISQDQMHSRMQTLVCIDSRLVQVKLINNQLHLG